MYLIGSSNFELRAVRLIGLKKERVIKPCLFIFIFIIFIVNIVMCPRISDIPELSLLLKTNNLLNLHVSRNYSYLLILSSRMSNGK